MTEYESIQTIVDNITDEIGGMPSSGQYIFEAISDVIDGEKVEFFQSSFGFDLNNKKFDAFNMSSEFVRAQHKCFSELRNIMFSKDIPKSQWKEACMKFENGKVEMSFKYPEHASENYKVT